MTGPAGRGHSRHQGLGASAGSGGWRLGRSCGQGWLIRAWVQALAPAHTPSLHTSHLHCMLPGPARSLLSPRTTWALSVYSRRQRSQDRHACVQLGTVQGDRQAYVLMHKPRASQGGGGESRCQSQKEHTYVWPRLVCLNAETRCQEACTCSATPRDFMGHFPPLPGACPSPLPAGSSEAEEG